MQISKNISSNDSAGRWGGDEFMVILPNTALEGAQKIAKAIKHSVKTSNVLPRGEHFTTSIGIAIAQHVDNALTIFQRVDSALYEAKKHKKSKSRSNK